MAVRQRKVVVRRLSVAVEGVARNVALETLAPGTAASVLVAARVRAATWAEVCAKLESWHALGCEVSLEEVAAAVRQSLG